MDAVIPTLSPDGWVQTASLKLDYLLSHFFLSEYSASYLHYGQITSLPWIIATYNQDATRMAKECESTLESYLSSYYDKVKVRVNVKESETGKAKMILQIAVKTKDGIGVTREDLAEIEGSRILKIARINRGEE